MDPVAVNAIEPDGSMSHSMWLGIERMSTSAVRSRGTVASTKVRSACTSAIARSVVSVSVKGVVHSTVRCVGARFTSIFSSTSWLSVRRLPGSVSARMKSRRCSQKWMSRVFDASSLSCVKDIDESLKIRRAIVVGPGSDT